MEALVSALNGFSIHHNERNELYDSSIITLMYFDYQTTLERYVRYFNELHDLEEELPEIHSLLCQFINTTCYDAEYYYYLSKIIDHKLLFILYMNDINDYTYE